VTATRHDIQPVVETIISRGLVEVVVGRDNKATYRCRYRIKSSERQQLQVDLQEGIEPLGQWVDGKAVSLEKSESATIPEGWESYFVNIARPGNSDQPFSLTLQFQLSLSAFEANAGSIQLKMPRIGGSGAVGVALQQLRVAVWLPDEFALVGTPDKFVREKGHVNLEEWIGTSASGLFDFPTEGRQYIYSSLGDAERLGVGWWRIRFVTWVVSGALVIVALVLRKTSWENKLSIVVVGAFVLAVIGTSDLDRVQQILLVAQYGLIALLAIWLVHALAGGRNHANHRPPQQPAEPIFVPDNARAAVIPPPGVFEMLADQTRDDLKSN
jgi:hypothetical protein